jgi:hypothetical protein
LLIRFAAAAQVIGARFQPEKGAIGYWKKELSHFRIEEKFH